MPCVLVGGAHACPTLLHGVTQLASQHLPARESSHRVSREPWTQFTARRDRPKAHMDEEWQKYPSMNLGYRTVLGYFHWPSPEETSPGAGNMGLLILHKNTHCLWPELALLIMLLLPCIFLSFFGEKKRLVPLSPLRMGRTWRSDAVIDLHPQRQANSDSLSINPRFSEQHLHETPQVRANSPQTWYFNPIMCHARLLVHRVKLF